MKKLFSIMLLLGLLAISTFAYEDLRYGVAVLGHLPEGSSADATLYANLAKEVTELIDYELISVDNIDGEVLTLEALDGHKVLVIPSLDAINDNSLAVIKNFVEDGGKLIISADKNIDLPLDFFELAGFTFSGNGGNLIKFTPENGLWDSEKTLALNSALAILPIAKSTELAYFINNNNKSGSAILSSPDAIVFSGVIFNNLKDNQPLIDLLIEAIYKLGDERILSGFSPLGSEEWRPIVQNTKAIVRRAKNALKTSEKQFNPPSDETLDKYVKADKTRELMELAFNTGNLLRISPYFKVAENLAKEVIAMTQPVRLYEARAVWMDSSTVSRAGTPNVLRDIIRQFHEAGFNMLLPEVVYHGKTMYPSKLDIQDTAFASWSEDPFRVIVDEAKKYGMEVHPWCWVFCAGYGHKFGPILEKHPDWAEQDEDGRVFSNWQYGTAWLNASMPEPREYLKELFLEIVSKYGVDGLHLDYIRYNEDSVGHFGLSEYSRNVFKSKYGFDPKSVRVGSNEWKIFDQWREDNVTSFVKEMTQAVKEIKPDLKISAAVVPDPNHSRKNVLQNWKNWADNKLLDFILTMAYTSNNSELKDKTIAGLTVTENKIWVYPGLGVYVNTSENNMSQVQLTRNLGTTGVAMFSTIHLLNDAVKLEDLKAGAFGKSAIIPHREPFKALKGLIEEAAATHLRAEMKETADQLQALAVTIPEKPASPVALMDEVALVLTKHLESLEQQRSERTINSLEYEALSGALLSAWRITQIYIYQNTERPFIMPEPR